MVRSTSILKHISVLWIKSIVNFNFIFLTPFLIKMPICVLNGNNNFRLVRAKDLVQPIYQWSYLMFPIGIPWLVSPVSWEELALFALCSGLSKSSSEIFPSSVCRLTSDAFGWYPPITVLLAFVAAEVERILDDLHLDLMHIVFCG